MAKHAFPKFRKTKAAAVATAVSAGIAIPAIMGGTAHAATESQWDSIAQCESGGDWTINYSSDGLSVGGLQFQNGSWHDALQYLDGKGYDTSGWTQDLYQGMPASQVPNKAETITAAEALLALQPNPWEASSSCSGVYLSQSDSVFNGGPTPADFLQPDSSSGSPAPADPTPVPAPPSTQPQQPVVTPPATSPAPHDNGDTHEWTVRPGDNLWNIAEKTYGHGKGWMYHHLAKQNHIHNPDLIQPGWVLNLS